MATSSSINSLPSTFPLDDSPKYIAVRLGQGSYGKVDKMTHPTLPPFARKSSWMGNSAVTDYNPLVKEFKFLKRARDANQAQIIHLLPPRPGQVDKISFKDGLLYFYIELASLGNLREYIQNHPRVIIDERFVCWVGGQVARGLGWLHGERILHGDLKPENLLVVRSNGPTPIIKIGDLGSSVQMSRSGNTPLNTIPACITTPLYAAPEMLFAGLSGYDIEHGANTFQKYFEHVLEQVTLASDVYSFGVTLAEIAGTQHPDFPVPVVQGLNQVSRMCVMRSNRRYPIEVYNPRFVPSAGFTQLLSDMTRENPLERPIIQDVRRSPVIFRREADFHLTEWADPKELAKLTKVNESLRIQLDRRESEVILAQQSLIFASGRVDRVTQIAPGVPSHSSIVMDSMPPIIIDETLPPLQIIDQIFLAPPAPIVTSVQPAVQSPLPPPPQFTDPLIQNSPAAQTAIETPLTTANHQSASTSVPSELTPLFIPGKVKSHMSILFN